MATRKHSQGISRRQLMLLTGAGVLATGVGAKLVVPKHSTTSENSEGSAITADEALTKLTQGNQRYVAFKRTYPDQDEVRLKAVAQVQHPFAVILGCADSRVPPELLFDQGLGDLFVIRVAGNILDDGTLASIEFATAELGVPLVMVLGHERCGAVKATLEGGEIPGHISRLVDAIKPAVAQIKGQAGDPLDNAVRANIAMVVGQIKSSRPILAKLVEQGKLKVVGARYDLDTGAIEMIS
jgi:carbonic anhydrase